MDLDRSCPLGISYPQPGIAEIRPRIVVGEAAVDHFYRLSLHGTKGSRIKVLILPEIVDVFFGYAIQYDRLRPGIFC